MSDEQAYEVHGLRTDGGSTYTVEVLGVQSPDAATALAQQHADLWRAQVKLYRVPFVHIGSAPWGEGQMHLICQVEPKPEGA
jgi:hypothetical protein